MPLSTTKETMRRIAALAELRLREGVAARLALLLPVAFLCGVGLAAWVPGADESTRAALADRAALGIASALAVLAAVVLASLGFPGDVRSGAAEWIVASPATRAAVVIGAVLGHGAFASVLLFGLCGAGLLGVEVGGLGAGARPMVRPVRDATAMEPSKDGAAWITRASSEARFGFEVPVDHAPGDAFVVHLRPQRRIESGLDARTGVELGVHRVTAKPSTVVRAEFKAGTGLVAEVPAGRLEAGEYAVLTVRRTHGEWALRFPPGSVGVGGRPERFTWNAIKAALCMVPLVLLAAAAASAGAARFGAPTALGLALFLALVWFGQDVIADGARYIAETSAEAAAAEHEGHDHGPARTPSPLRRALARGALVAVEWMPPRDAFDRTGDLAESRAVPLWAAGRAAALAAVPVVLLTGIGWLLLRRREILSG